VARTGDCGSPDVGSTPIHRTILLLRRGWQAIRSGVIGSANCRKVFTGGSVSGKPPVFEAGFGRSTRSPPANWLLAQSGSALRSERRGFRFDP
jgi:hypothetical protein